MKPNLSEIVAEHRTAAYDIDPVILERWSPRSFSDRNVDESTLLSLLEAARWAPSGSNEQPWRFIIATTAEEKQAFYPFIMEGNRIWCEKAPALILIVSAKTGSRGPNPYHAFDTGAAWAFLALEAARKGLYTHAMGGFYADKARETLGIPDDYEPQVVVAVGYIGEKESLPPQLQEREKPSTRRPLEESVFRGTFGRKLEG
jgi:nitroreductase